VLTLGLVAKSVDEEIKLSFSRNLWHQSIVMFTENLSCGLSQSGNDSKTMSSFPDAWAYFASSAGDPFHLFARVRSR